jgi:UDP-3-O-[3-hydroxymyristoyl] glucosamine N-acyltransferase
VTDRVAAARAAGGEGGSGPLTASAIAALVSGNLSGDGDALVHAVAPLDRAGAGELSFLASRRYLPQFERSGAAVVLVPPDLADAPGAPSTRISVARPHEAILALLPRLYRAPARERGVHETARIGRGVRLGDGVAIGPYVVIEDGASIGNRVVLDAHVVVGRGVAIGDDAHLLPGVTLYPGAVIGARVRLHAGVRVASDGFGYVFRDGGHQKIPHVGRCIVEDDVEIGANSTIDRGSIDDTVIGAGSKIDNLVHVGHNVRIGTLCLVMAQVGIAGSTRIGNGVILAGQAGIGGHLTIGDRVRIGGQGGVMSDVPDGETWSGYPARPHGESMRQYAALGRLSTLLRKIERLVEGRDA